MMTATISVPATGTSQSTASMAEASKQVVTSLVNAGKQAYTSPYTVTVKKIEPVAASNQVRVTFFVTGEDEPAHHFTETGNQVVAALLNAGMRANISGAGAAKVEKIEAVEGGDDDSDDDSDADALSGLVANADAPPQPPQPTSSMTPNAPAGNVPTLPDPPSTPDERPTTSASSPVRQPGTTLGEAAGEEAAQTTPAEHEEPPHQQ